MTMGDRVLIRDARPEDLATVQLLLEAVDLPTLGVEEHFHSYLVAEENNRLVGAIGIEVYESVGLLRSAVVVSDRRNSRIGARLYDALQQKAVSLGVRKLVLLTNTAEGYFHRKGFRRVDRSTITGPVTRSVEFTDACPSHAVSMELVL